MGTGGIGDTDVGGGKERGRRRDQTHRRGERRQLGGDIVVARVRFQDSLVPAAGAGGVPFPLGDVAQVAEGLQVFRVEGQRLLKHHTCPGQIARFVQGLSKHDVAAHVLGLLGQAFPAKGDRL